MFCRNCGRELTGTPEVCINCGAKPMAGTSFCPGCGAPTMPLTEVCTKCGSQVAKTTKEKTWKPTVAGILCIIAGAIGVISGIALAVFFASSGAGWFGAVTGAPLTILGIVAIVGGIYALRRRRWGLALAGSICTLIGCVIFMIFGAIVFLGGYSDNPEVIPFDATGAEILAIILSDWVLMSFVVGSMILGVLGMLAIIFVTKGKREFK